MGRVYSLPKEISSEAALSAEFITTTQRMLAQRVLGARRRLHQFVAISSRSIHQYIDSVFGHLHWSRQWLAFVKILNNHRLKAVGLAGD